MLFSIAFLFACKKDPVQGPAGKDGKDASVLTYDYVVYDSLWTLNSNIWRVNISEPAITQDVVDKGSVTVYVASGPNWYAIPSSILDIEYSYAISLNKLTLLYSSFEAAVDAPVRLHVKIVITKTS